MPTFFELWSGSCVLSASMLSYGFLCRAFEKEPTGLIGEETQDRGDLGLFGNQSLIRRSIESALVWLLHMSPPCGPWSLIQNFAGSTRTSDLPQGDGSREVEVVGNKQMAQCLWYIFLCLRFGCLFSFEHPRGTRALLLPLFKFVLELAGVRLIDYDGCAHGLRPPGWNSSQGDIRLQNPSVLVTNCPYFEVICRKCASVGSHKHESSIAWHDRAGGSHLKYMGRYPQGLCVCYSRASVTAWKEKFQPVKHDIPYVPLETLEANVGVTPDELFSANPIECVEGVVRRKLGVRARAVGEKSSDVSKSTPSSSSAGAAPVSKHKQPTQDFWVETDTQWIWRHVVPRYVFCTPSDPDAPPNGPQLDQISHRREVFCVSVKDSKTYYVDDKDYTCKPTTRHRKVTNPFVGSSVFTKRDALKPPKADVDPSPPVIVPNSLESLSMQLSSMRKEMSVAQLSDPALKAIISCLKKEPAGTYLADPLREGLKTRSRAAQYCYRNNSEGLGLLMCHDPELQRDLPVVPEIVYDGSSKSKDAPKRMTWKHLLLGAVHNTATGNHKNPKDMVNELKQLCAWQRPWELRGDCEKWNARCKLCVSVHTRNRTAPPLGTVKGYKPFFRMQWDMMEVKPTGEDGETYVLTAICPSTKYPFLRPLTTRDSEVVAAAMLDVILDCGVVPCIHQSDNEFCNLAVSELIGLLGATQLFSAALRPQSQGLVERIHRDIRAGLAMAVEALCRAKPRRWPRHLRRLEYKLRHKLLANGQTPYQAVHGFVGSSSLASALGALDEIPEELVFSSWLQEIVSESSRINAELEILFEEQAEARERKQAETVPETGFTAGELVLLRKPFYEKGEGVILPQADGPYAISAVLDPHGVVLEDPLTGEAACRGVRVATARLIKYDFPQEWAAIDLQEDMAPQHEVAVGTLVAVRSAIGRNAPRVHVGRVERFFPAQNQLEVTLFEVPRGSRLGPWTRRPWTVKLDLHTRAVIKQVFAMDEVLAVVELIEGALTQRSLELLSAVGVDVSPVPTLDATLPDVQVRA